PGVPWNDPANLVTTTRYVPAGDFEGRVASVLHPDGTMAIHEYTRQGNNIVTTMRNGAPNEARTAIIDGVVSTTVTGPNGRTVSLSVVDIVSGITLEDRQVTGLDGEGRPLGWNYLDGSTTTLVYNASGLASETDRLGITTDYT